MDARETWSVANKTGRVRSMYPTISKLFDDAVATYRDRVSLRMPIPKERKHGRGIQLILNEVSYGRLGEMVGRLATALADLGVVAGDRVALISKPRAAWATSFYAILRCGAVVVPLDPELQPGEISRILTEADVKGIITSGGKVDDLLEMRDASLSDVFVVTMDRVSDERALFLDALLLGKTPLPRVDVDPDSTAILMYTSGTTGNAKGAMLTHANISSNATTAAKVVDLSPEDTFLSIVPWNHIYGLTITLITPLVAGGTTSYTPVDRNLAAVMKKAQPTIILGVPKLYNVLYGRIQDSIKKSALKRMIYRSSPTLMGRLVKNKLFGKQFRFFTSGGAPLSPEASAGFRGMGIGIMEGYGLTETAPLLTMCEAFAEEPGMTAIEGIEIRIDHPDEDGVGEILARTEHHGRLLQEPSRHRRGHRLRRMVPHRRPRDLQERTLADLRPSEECHRPRDREERVPRGDRVGTRQHSGDRRGHGLRGRAPRNPCRLRQDLPELGGSQERGNRKAIRRD